MKVPSIVLVASAISACGSLAPPPSEPRQAAVPPSSTESRAATLKPEQAPPPGYIPMAVQPSSGDSVFVAERDRALQGDKDAALRVALMYKDGTNGLPRDEFNMVRWLEHASDLNSGAASYQLYLYYLYRGMDRYAVHYENRALRQGFVPPPRLDNKRG